MIDIFYTSKFKKDYKKVKKRGYSTKELEKVLKFLSNGQSLPATYKDHCLSGGYSGCRECHIMPDWLLIYKFKNNNLILVLCRTGTHSDLF